MDGVPRFVSGYQYWGEVDQDLMAGINARMATEPWQEVLRSHSSPDVQRWRPMVTNLDRANWHLLLSLPRESTIVDLGAGSGAVSHAMAKAYRQVVAVEPVSERVEFMRHRFRQEGLENIALICGDCYHVPLPPKSADLVILNGVLEWIPCGRVTGNPRRVQREALMRIRELLRPGGVVCIGIENRWTIELLLGAKDPHADIPYVAVLPRFLANAYSRWRTRHPYRNYIYSVRGYRRLLASAGFQNIQVYCAIPSYNYPRFIFPFEEDVFSFYKEHFDSFPGRPSKRLFMQMLRYLGLDKHLVYSFFLIARSANG